MTDRGQVTGAARRGIALGIVVVTSLVFAIAAYAVLYAANSLGSRANFQKRNTSARYAAEAGLVWAMQKLWANPAECFNANPDFSFDTDGNPTTKAMAVDVIATPCPTAVAGAEMKLQAKVAY